MIRADAPQITLFGQSAGSISIGDLLLTAGLDKYGVRSVVSVGFDVPPGFSLSSLVTS